MRTLLVGSGVFTLVLGIVHFFFPYLLDFQSAIGGGGPPLKEFRLGFIRHPTTRKDVLTVAWLMNHHVSYTLVTIGAIDLSYPWWIGNPLAPVISFWIAGWWILRVLWQTYFDRSAKSILLIAVFVVLGAIHAGMAFVGI